MMKRRPPHSHSYCTRSRVTPGVSSTIASRRPINRLIRVDLPTFGRPRIATIGRPKSERCDNSSQIRSTVSSSVSSVESICTASVAIDNGEIVRFVSISSRVESDCATASTPPAAPSCSASRLAARAEISAVR